MSDLPPPQTEISTRFDVSQSIRKTGDVSKALAELQQLGANLEGKTHLQAELVDVYLETSVCHSLLGNYQAGLDNLTKAGKIFANGFDDPPLRVRVEAATIETYACLAINTNHKEKRDEYFASAREHLKTGETESQKFSEKWNLPSVDLQLASATLDLAYYDNNSNESNLEPAFARLAKALSDINIINITAVDKNPLQLRRAKMFFLRGQALALETGDMDTRTAAHADLNHAFSLYQQLNDRSYLAQVALEIGGLYLDRKDPEGVSNAGEWLKKAMELSCDAADQKTIFNPYIFTQASSALNGLKTVPLS